MGADIYMNIVRDGKEIHHDIFDGRCSEWFDNLSGHGYGGEYEYLPVEYGICDNPTEATQKAYDSKDYYDFRYITVGDFKQWYNTHHPEKDAGWLTHYEEFMLRVKHTIPSEPKRFLFKDDNLAEDEYIWCEWEKDYENSRWLYNFLCKNLCQANDIIEYYFSC